MSQPHPTPARCLLPIAKVRLGRVEVALLTVHHLCQTLRHGPPEQDTHRADIACQGRGAVRGIDPVGMFQDLQVPEHVVQGVISVLQGALDIERRVTSFWP